MMIVFYLIFHLLFVFGSSCLLCEKIPVHFCGDVLFYFYIHFVLLANLIFNLISYIFLEICFLLWITLFP